MYHTWNIHFLIQVFHSVTPQNIFIMFITCDPAMLVLVINLKGNSKKKKDKKCIHQNASRE